MPWYWRVPAVLRISIYIVPSAMSFQVTSFIHQFIDKVSSFQGISIFSSTEPNFSTGVCVVSSIMRS